MKKQNFKSRHFKGGSYSAVLTVFVLAIIIVVNLLISALPANYTKFDFSEQKLFSITDQTKKVVENLDQEVTVYLIAQSGKEESVLVELLDKYEALSSKLKVVKKDPAVYPTFVGQYTTNTLNDNSLIVESGNRSRVIAYENFFTAGYNSTGTSTREFNGEDLITSAVDYVTSKEALPKMYVISGHGESAMDTSFQAKVERENIELEGLKLATARTIPEDATALFMQAPTSDINETEAAVLSEYLKKGGHLFYTSYFQKEDTPNLDKVLTDYGVHIEPGYVCEGDSNYYIQNYKSYIVANFGSHDITTPLVNNSRYVVVQFGQNIKKLDDKRSTVNVTSLLKTTSAAYLKNFDESSAKDLSMEKADGDKTGIMSLASLISEETPKGTTKIVIVTTPSLFSAATNTIVSGGNYDFLLNAVNYLCENESMISIRSKDIDSQSLVVNSGAAVAWMGVLMILIPLACTGFGLIVWMRRRKR